MGNLLEFWHLFPNWPIVVGQNPTCFVMKAEQLQEWSTCAVLWTLSRTGRKWEETLSEVWWTVSDRPETVSWSQYRCRCSIGVVIEIRSKTACQSCRNRSPDPCSCKRPDVAHFDFQVHHTAANDAVFRVVVGMVLCSLKVVNWNCWLWLASSAVWTTLKAEIHQNFAERPRMAVWPQHWKESSILAWNESVFSSNAVTKCLRMVWSRSRCWKCIRPEA